MAHPARQRHAEPRRARRRLRQRGDFDKADVLIDGTKIAAVAPLGSCCDKGQNTVAPEYVLRP